MSAIKIKIEDGVKKINNQTIENIIKDLNSEHTNIEEIKKIFKNINSEEDLILELKNISKNKIKVLKYIMYLGNLSVIEANTILEKVISEQM